MQAIIEILQAGMPAALGRIRTEYAAIDTTASPATSSKPVPLPDIGAYYFGQRSTVPTFPSVIVDAGPVRLDPERFATRWADYDHTIMVAVLVQSDDEDVISRQLLRYARAIWEVLFANQVVQPSPGLPEAISLMPQDAGQSNLVPANNQLQRAYAWRLSVHRYDDLT